VLLDDVGARANDENLLALDAHPNIEIRLFNPVASRDFKALGMLGDFSRLNRRMHNKAFIADNQAAILGGRNIGDEYFEAGGEVAFGDLDLAVAGPMVRQLSQSFDTYWNDRLSVPVESLPLGKPPAVELEIRARHWQAQAENGLVGIRAFAAQSDLLADMMSGRSHGVGEGRAGPYARQGSSRERWQPGRLVNGWNKRRRAQMAS
jgi:phosphatidylserine/phosphatidylglycerophosphate/cardiolipin synthase-like enzyme